MAAIAGQVGLPGARAETRSLKLYYLHTGEKAEIAFKKDGRYIDAGLKRINYFLRDWRRGEPTKMDPALLDLVWEVYRKSGSSQPIHVVSAYRSPATNNMLRSRSRGVAKNSQHTFGKAMDFFLPDVKLSTLREIGLKVGGGGVGFYPTSGSPFVHMDTGNVRHWPRMSRQELARVFPDGKTLHVPSDGKPLPGYNQAVAAYKTKSSGSGFASDDSEEEEKQPNFFQRLAQKWKQDREKGGNPAEPAAEVTQIAQATDSASEDAGDQKPVPGEPLLAEPAVAELALARIPVPTLAPRSAVLAGQPIDVAAGAQPATDDLPKLVAAAEILDDRQNIAWPQRRPNLALALADAGPDETFGENSTLIAAAALTADEIEYLRSAAVPVERPARTASADAVLAFGSNRPLAASRPAPFEIALAAPQFSRATDAGLLPFDQDSEAGEDEAADIRNANAQGSQARISLASTLGERTARPQSGNSAWQAQAAERSLDSPARPSNRTLELALAPVAESRGRAIEAIRALIEADSAITPSAEPLTGSISAFLPVPQPNPHRKRAFTGIDSNGRSTTAGSLTAKIAAFQRPDFDMVKVAERPTAVLLAGFVKTQILQPVGRLVRREARISDFVSFR